MITRLYADNFKTLVNFELKLGPMNLLLGANGSGKSNVLEVFRKIWNFVFIGKDASAYFPTSSLCRWDNRNVQTLKLTSSVIRELLPIDLKLNMTSNMNNAV